MSTQVIVGFGEALVDVLPSGEVVGGAPLNFSIRAAELCQRLGWRAALVTRIGADDRGERVLTRLTQAPLDNSAVQVDSSRQTGYVDVSLTDGQPSYRIGEQVAWDEIQFDDQLSELARQTNTLCFGTLAQRSPGSRETLQRFLEHASQATKILDINVRKPYPVLEVVQSSLQAADILKCNEEELLQLASWLALQAQDSAEKIAHELLARFELRAVFWTRGSQGCRWQDAEQMIDAPVPRLTAESDADSVGAGDAASAALAVGVTADWPPTRIVEAANLLGAFAASRRGPTAPLPEELIDQVLNNEPSS